MEVGPTTHYVMGGVRVDADTQMSTVPGLFAAGECAGGLHGANRLGGNSLSDLLVFGERAGAHAARFAAAAMDTVAATFIGTPPFRDLKKCRHPALNVAIVPKRGRAGHALRSHRPSAIVRRATQPYQSTRREASAVMHRGRESAPVGGPETDDSVAAALA